MEKSKIIKEKIVIDGKEFSFQVGPLAPAANGSVTVRVGDTIVLATAVASKKDTELDYFPLFVEYQEKLYAGGKIKGSRWVKREGRPSDEAILTARLVDRSLRPLFDKDFRKEVQIIITVLSVDGENDPDIPAILAASAALSISDIPWQGPVAAIRVGLKEKDFFSNPEYKQREFSDLDLVISGTKKAIVMVEAGGDQVSEERFEEAFSFAQKRIKKIAEAIEELTKKIGKAKQPIVRAEIDKQVVSKIEGKAKKTVEEILKKGKKGELDLSPLGQLKEDLREEYKEESKGLIFSIIDELFKKKAREQLLKEKVRVDGRKPEEIRPISANVKILPRTHGSALFQRGATQALTITTLGSPSLEQYLETMEGEETKRYIHHYFMPPYSVGETGRLGWPSRREVGHGALSERALTPLIPSEEKFPYTIRVVSEITACNGSTSMASVCGSTLSLMDAGVPIKEPVAGIAMGLIMESQAKSHAPRANQEHYIILTDILGEEDHLGDMDFKVAGTKEGITALQMDIKTLGIDSSILTKALSQAKKARLFILGKMLDILPRPRANVSEYAPKIAVLHVVPEKIGEVIGSGGRTIRNIINTTGCTIDVDDDGSVTISGTSSEAVSKAIAWVEGLTREIHPGEIFEGTVKRIERFGAFVEILPQREGLVHVSRMPGYVSHPNKVLKIGQKLKVRVFEIDNLGRINLSMIFDRERQRRSRQPSRPLPGFKSRRERR